MKNIIVIILLAIVLCTQGQDTTKTVSKWSDIGVFMVCRFNPNTNKPVLWVNHEEGKYFLEVRRTLMRTTPWEYFLAKPFQRTQSFGSLQSLVYCFPSAMKATTA